MNARQLAAAREARLLARLSAPVHDHPPGPSAGPQAPGTSLALRPLAAVTRRSGVATLAHAAWRLLWRGWRLARELSGDDAYERYVAHVARAHPDQQPMTRAEHYRLVQDEKWSRLSRCC
jgi:uncharacterized short protein YbdD (DUF466 family)